MTRGTKKALHRFPIQDIAETLGARIEVRDNKPKGTIFLIKFKNI